MSGLPEKIDSCDSHSGNIYTGLFACEGGIFMMNISDLTIREREFCGYFSIIFSVVLTIVIIKMIFQGFNARSKSKENSDANLEVPTWQYWVLWCVIGPIVAIGLMVTGMQFIF